MWKFLAIEVLFALAAAGLVVYVWIKLNNSKKFTKVVKDVRYKPEEPDADAPAGTPSGEETK